MAASGWRLFLAQHDSTIGMAVIAILIFLVGWQTGRVMSPYYASSPIVFEDRTCNTCPSSVGTSQTLQDVREGTKPPVNSTESIVDDPGASNVPAGQQGLYVGSKNSTLFHHYTCASAQTIKAENQVWYATYQEAAQAGRSPSSCTQKLGL